jgi:hypothetical protein
MGRKGKRLSSREFERRVKVGALGVPLLVASVTTATTLYVSSRSKPSTTYVVVPGPTLPSFPGLGSRSGGKFELSIPVLTESSPQGEIASEAEARRKEIDALPLDQRVKALEAENDRLRGLLAGGIGSTKFASRRFAEPPFEPPGDSWSPVGVVLVFGVVFLGTLALFRAVVWRLRRNRQTEPEAPPAST